MNMPPLLSLPASMVTSMADKKDLLVSATFQKLHKKIDQVGDFLLQKKKQLLVLPAQRQNRFLAPAPSPSLLRDPRLCFAAAIPGDSAVEYVITSGTYQFLNIYNTVLIARIVLTWFPGAPQQIVSPLATLADPYLNAFRGLIPPIGGSIDLSPILAFVVLNAFQSTAAALPAEMNNRATTTSRAATAGRTGAARIGATSKTRAHILADGFVAGVSLPPRKAVSKAVARRLLQK